MSLLTLKVKSKALNMSRSVKKRKTTNKQPPVSPPILSLPNDLLLNCFARASRLYYPTLSLVSKSLGSLIASPELYQTRSSLGNTESCLYVCLSFPPEPNPRWYTLCKKPNPNISNDISTRKKKKKPCGYVLAEIHFPHPPRAHPSRLVSVGSNIYNIGCDNDEASSRVSILDCRSQTWFDGPRMHMERIRPVINVIDGKICVTDNNASNLMEVFDSEMQTWELVRCPGKKLRGTTRSKIAGIDGKVYNPKDGKWESLGWYWEPYYGWIWSSSYNVISIGNVLYTYDGGLFKWCDIKVREWKNLMGVKGLLPEYGITLADYGGKMVVLWHRKARGCKGTTIWCAVIELQRRNNDEDIWGKVEWYDAVLTLDDSCSIKCALSVTV